MLEDGEYLFYTNSAKLSLAYYGAGTELVLNNVKLEKPTNTLQNEVSAEEAKAQAEKGYQPGDPEWERLGIARYVTWPRTVCSIQGHDVNGQPLKGNYLGGDHDHPIAMSEGFAANAAFFKLGFLDKTAVALGRQFKELLPVLRHYVRG